MAGQTISHRRVVADRPVPRTSFWRGGPMRVGVLTYVGLIAVLLVSAFPFYWMFVVASNSNAVMSQFPPAVTPGPNFLRNAREVFTEVPFARALLNSTVVAGTITLSVLLFSTLAGFAFAKLQFRGRGVLFAFVVGTIMVPQTLGLIPLQMLMARLGWVDSLRAVIVPGLVTAFGVFWMRQYITGAVPDELLEAGRVDGCSTIRLFRHVVAPAVRPAMAVLGLFTFLTAWNEFLWPLVVLNSKNNWTVQIALRNLNDQYYTNYSMVMAATLLSVVPLIVVFLLLARQMVDGIMHGAVKG